jgi:hypothetical protein
MVNPYAHGGTRMSGVTADDVNTIGQELRRQGWHVRRHRAKSGKPTGVALIASTDGGGRVVISMAGGHSLDKLLARLSRMGVTGIGDWPLSSQRVTRRYPAVPDQPPPAEPSEEDSPMPEPSRTISNVTTTREALAELESMARPDDVLAVSDMLAWFPRVSQNAFRQALDKRRRLGLWRRVAPGQYAYIGSAREDTMSGETAVPGAPVMPDAHARDNEVSPGLAPENAPPSDPAPVSPTTEGTRHMFERREPPVRLLDTPSPTWETLATDLAKLAHSDARDQWHQLAQVAPEDLPEDLALSIPDGRALELVITAELEVFARWVPSA